VLGWGSGTSLETLGTISAGQLRDEKSRETDQWWGSRAERIYKNRLISVVWGVPGGSWGEVLETIVILLVCGGSRVGPGGPFWGPLLHFFASERFWEQLLEGPVGSSKLAQILMQT